MTFSGKMLQVGTLKLRKIYRKKQTLETDLEQSFSTFLLCDLHVNINTLTPSARLKRPSRLTSYTSHIQVRRAKDNSQEKRKF